METDIREDTLESGQENPHKCDSIQISFIFRVVTYTSPAK